MCWLDDCWKRSILDQYLPCYDSAFAGGGTLISIFLDKAELYDSLDCLNTQFVSHHHKMQNKFLCWLTLAYLCSAVECRTLPTIQPELSSAMYSMWKNDTISQFLNYHPSPVVPKWVGLVCFDYSPGPRWWWWWWSISGSYQWLLFTATFGPAKDCNRSLVASERFDLIAES